MHPTEPSNYHNECGNTQALSRSRVQVSLWPGKNHKRLPSDELQLIIFTSFQWAPLSPWAHMYMYVHMCGMHKYVWNVSFFIHLLLLFPPHPLPHGALNFSSLVSLYLLFGFVLNCCVNQANQLRGNPCKKFSIAEGARRHARSHSHRATNTVARLACVFHIVSCGWINTGAHTHAHTVKRHAHTHTHSCILWSAQIGPSE